jgi:catecholate siderophore receptor
MKVLNNRARNVSYLAMSCVGFIASAPAFANEAADAAADAAEAGADRPTIVVNGHHDELAIPKAVAPLLNTPRSIVTVDRQVIKDTASATLVDALRTVPGITFGAAEGGNPIGDRPFIRGYDSQGSTFLDGVRDSAAQTREVFAVDQIQVVRGSDSTLGGRGSAGGSLNIMSKLPEREDFIAGTVTGGTADYKRITGDVNYHLTDSIGVRVAGMWHDQDVAGRDAIWQKRWGIAPSVTVGMGTPTQLTVSYYHVTTEELPDSGIPYLYACSATLCNAPLGKTLSEPAIGNVTTASGATGYVDRSTFYGLVDRDFRNSTTDQVTMRAQHDFGGITLRNTARFTHNTQDYIFLLPDDSTGNVFGNPANLTAQPGGQVWRRANTRYGYVDTLTDQMDLYGKFKTGGIEHSFAIGGEWSKEKARRGTFVTRGYLNASTGVEILSQGSTISPRCNTATVARFYCTSLFNPNPNDPWVNYASDTSTVQSPIVKSLPIEETQVEGSTKALYAFDSITLTPWLIANLGLRYDDFTSKVTPGQAANATSTFTLTRQDKMFNYQVGLIAKPTPNTSVYANLSTSSTPPNSLIGEGQEQNSLGTTASAATLLDTLKVEKSKSWEVGAKADLFDNRLSLNVALFKTDTSNARVVGADNTAQFIGKKEVKGVEFGFNGQILPSLNVFGGYTYLDATIVDGGFIALTAAAVPGQAAKTVNVASPNTGKQFPQTAKHSFTIWTNFQPIERLSIGGGAFYTSRVYGGYADNRIATQNSAGVVTVTPATKEIARSIPGYWRFDARVGLKINDHVDLALNVQNLTNAVFFTQAYTSHYATIGAGRTILGTLNFKY